MVVLAPLLCKRIFMPCRHKKCLTILTIMSIIVSNTKIYNSNTEVHMWKKGAIISCLSFIVILFAVASVWAGGQDEGEVRIEETITITDGMGREITVPFNPNHVICSGAGCLRYLTYLRSQDRIVAVDDIEKRNTKYNARPYSIANPQFKDYPLFGEFRGHDNPELIVGLDPMPQIIFKTYGTSGHNPEELQRKTGIPVVVLNYGDLVNYREDMDRSLRLMGNILSKDERAEEVIAFFDDLIKDLETRTADIPETERKICYVGGIGFRGTHGFRSTQPIYPPFLFTNSRNVAYDPSKAVGELEHAVVAKEKIVEWNPQIIFVDLATITADPASGALYELKNDPVYQRLDAVQSGEVYALLPYNNYTQNFGSTLANAYYIGTVLYPERFRDIDTAAKADEIYTFLVGKPVYGEINRMFDGLAFKKISL